MVGAAWRCVCVCFLSSRQRVQIHEKLFGDDVDEIIAPLFGSVPVPRAR